MHCCICPPCSSHWLQPGRQQVADATSTLQATSCTTATATQQLLSSLDTVSYWHGVTCEYTRSSPSATGLQLSLGA
jgi:hypothetical protein